MPFAAAVSTHPITAVAAGEVTGQVLETLGPHPDLVCCFVTAGHAGALEDLAATVEAVLAPTLLLGCTSEAVLGNSTEVESGSGVALWAGMVGPVAPLRLSDPGEALAAARRAPFERSGVVVLADPYTFGVEEWLDGIARNDPGIPVAGGLSTGRLLLGGDVVSGGAVGALIGPGTEFEAVVSQGCSSIGRPLTVTRSEGNIVYELGGRPALSRLVEIAEDQMPAGQVRLINQGLHLGIAVDEGGDEPVPGSLLMRPVLGADRASGAIAVAAQVAVGSTVQFSVRDAEAADADLHSVLAGLSADGALLFSCNGRGRAMFSEPNHDVEAVGAELGHPPLAGFFAAGEVGPAGGRAWLHGQSAALALFRER